MCFFFQAEDGIRDIGVTGVQTCALPIYMRGALPERLRSAFAHSRDRDGGDRRRRWLDRAYRCLEACHGRAGKRELGEIGRASCRERVEISVVAVSLKKKNEKVTGKHANF